MFYLIGFAPFQQRSEANCNKVLTLFLYFDHFVILNLQGIRNGTSIKNVKASAGGKRGTKMKSHYEINNQYSTTILSTSSLINIVLPIIKIRLRELDFSKDRTDRGEDGKGESTIIFYHHNYNSKCPFHHHHHFHHYHFHHHQCNYDPGQGWGRPKDWDLLGGFSRYYKCQTCS